MPQLLLMQHGSATYLEVLIARQSLLQAEIEQAQNRLTEMCGVIDLYIALGGASE
jgi:outer membrane protein TolC